MKNMMPLPIEHFIKQAKKTPNNLAVVWEENNELQAISYELLQLRVYQLANYFKTNGLINKGPSGPIQRVGVCLPRTLDYVVTLFACWHLGLVYVPLSDASRERLGAKKVQEELKKRLEAFTQENLLTTVLMPKEMERFFAEKLEYKGPLLNYPDQNYFIEACDEEPKEESLAAEEAYVFCSSGSTGTPKIIALPPDGIYGRIESVAKSLQIKAGEGILNYTPFDFDPSLMEILLALWYGATLYIVPEIVRQEQSLAKFNQKIKEKNWPMPAHAIFLPSILKSPAVTHLQWMPSDCELKRENIAENVIILQKQKKSIKAYFVKNDQIIQKTLLLKEEESAFLEPSDQNSDEEIIHYLDNSLINKIALLCGCTTISPWDFPDLRCLLITGENYDRDWLQPWFEDGNSRQIFNGYGPTETTFGATNTEILLHDNITINQPMNGIDLRFAPLPPEEEPSKCMLDSSISLPEALARNDMSGQECEIYLGGNGIGWYIGKDAEEKNNLKFITWRDQRYFRTNDSAKVYPREAIFFGRIDRILKYHGKQISLDDLEREFQSPNIPEVKEAYAVQYAAEDKRDTHVVFLFIDPVDELKEKDEDQNQVDEKRNKIASLIRERLIYLNFRPALFLLMRKSPLKSSREKKVYDLNILKECELTSLNINNTQSKQHDPMVIKVSKIWHETLQEGFAKAHFEAGVRALKLKDYDDEHEQEYYDLNATFDEIGGDSLSYVNMVKNLWNNLSSKGIASCFEYLFKSDLLHFCSLGEIADIAKLYENFKPSPLPHTKEKNVQKVIYISTFKDSSFEMQLPTWITGHQIKVENPNNLIINNQIWAKKWLEMLKCYLEYHYGHGPYHIIIPKSLRTDCEPLFNYKSVNHQFYW